MTREQLFADMRKALNEGLLTLEAGGGSMQDAGADIVKIGVHISLAASGAADTLQGIMELFEQLSEIFPEQSAAVEIGRRFPAVEGRA